MSRDLSSQGPLRNESQEIGEDAVSALHANKPKSWSLSEPGGLDFGYDFSATAFEEPSDGAQFAFNIQLKGTTKPEHRSADGSFLSYPFNRTTLNLWHRSGFAVIVAIADFIDGQDPKTAPVYYKFANPDLQDKLPELPPDQATINLRVPTDQLISRDLNIVPVVRRFLDEIQEFHRVSRERRRLTGEISTSVSVASGATPAVLERVDSWSYRPALEALIERLSERNALRDALNSLRAGSYERVLEQLDSDLSPEAKGAEVAAVAAHLRAGALDAIGKYDEAAAEARVAFKLMPDFDDFIASNAQVLLDSIALDENGADGRAALLETLAGHNGPSTKTVRAKILALSGDFSSARELISDLPDSVTVLTKPILSIVERDWTRAIGEAQEGGKVGAITERQRFLLLALEAKASLELALADVDRPGPEFIVPFSGMKGINYAELTRAFQVSLAGMLAAQRLGWPASAQHLLDVFPISAMLLDRGEEVVPLLADFGLARASVAQVREVACKFCIQFDRPEVALEIGSRRGSHSKYADEDAVMAVANIKAGRSLRAFESIDAGLMESVLETDASLISLAEIAVAANSSLRFDIVSKIRAYLSQKSNGKAFEAIIDACIAVHERPLARTDVLRDLVQKWNDLGRPTVLAGQIIGNSNCANEAEAAVVVEVCTHQLSGSDLSVDQFVQLGRALLTLNRPNDAIQYLNSARQRFASNSELLALFAIALEAAGRSAEAFTIIGELLDRGVVTESAQRLYISIAARFGFLVEAEGQIRSAIARSTNREKTLAHLQALFQVLRARGTEGEEVERVAWEYGRLANRESESEEGLFLQMYLFATLGEDIEVSQDRKAELRERLDRYSGRFPNSRYIWRSDVPINGPPEAMVSAIQKAIGLTDEAIAHDKDVQAKMDRGLLHVPFSWRPRKFLRNIPDIFFLWEVRKRASVDQASLHFQASAQGFLRRSSGDLSERKVLLSKTSLLLLDELGILEDVVSRVGRVVIARHTLIDFQEATFGLSEFGRLRAASIVRTLQSAFAKIEHPPEQENDEDSIVPWHTEEKEAVAQGAVYFCDDIVETSLVCGTGDSSWPSIGCVEYLDWAHSSGVISGERVSGLLAEMIRLKIGAVVVGQAYLLAAVAGVEEGRVDAAVLEVLLKGLWYFEKEFAVTRSHAASLIAHAINESLAGESVLAEVFLAWFGVVRFQAEPRIEPMTKIAILFAEIARLLRDDPNKTRLLWRILWQVLRIAAQTELKEPEDVAGVRVVSDLLGRLRANPKSEAQAVEIFNRCLAGLEEGTDLHGKFMNGYIESSAQAALRRKDTG